MSLKVRFGVFETNSSNTHTLTIVAKDEFEQFKNEKMFLLEDYELITMEQAEKEYEKVKDQSWYDDFDDWKNQNLKSYDDFINDYCFETYEYPHTTKNGDEIVAFGKFGNDNC